MIYTCCVLRNICSRIWEIIVIIFDTVCPGRIFLDLTELFIIIHCYIFIHFFPCLAVRANLSHRQFNVPHLSHGEHRCSKHYSMAYSLSKPNFHSRQENYRENHLHMLHEVRYTVCSKCWKIISVILTYVKDLCHLQDLGGKSKSLCPEFMNLYIPVAMFPIGNV